MCGVVVVCVVREPLLLLYVPAGQQKEEVLKAMRDLYETREGVPRMITCVLYLSRLYLFFLALPRP